MLKGELKNISKYFWSFVKLQKYVNKTARTSKIEPKMTDKILN